MNYFIDFWSFSSHKESIIMQIISRSTDLLERMLLIGLNGIFLVFWCLTLPRCMFKIQFLSKICLIDSTPPNKRCRITFMKLYLIHLHFFLLLLVETLYLMIHCILIGKIRTFAHPAPYRSLTGGDSISNALTMPTANHQYLSSHWAHFFSGL